MSRRNASTSLSWVSKAVIQRTIEVGLVPHVEGPVSLQLGDVAGVQAGEHRVRLDRVGEVDAGDRRET